MSTKQLRLIDARDVSWRLDEQTKAIGREGIARARAALAAARPRPATTVEADRRHAA
ncbi:MAG: hypothetical protein AB7O92_14885 [Acidimicrobiia bacterium]